MPHSVSRLSRLFVRRRARPQARSKLQGGTLYLPQSPVGDRSKPKRARRANEPMVQVAQVCVSRTLSGPKHPLLARSAARRRTRGDRRDWRVRGPRRVRGNASILSISPQEFKGMVVGGLRGAGQKCRRRLGGPRCDHRPTVGVAVVGRTLNTDYRTLNSTVVTTAYFTNTCQ